MIDMAGQRYLTTQNAHKTFKESRNMGASLIQLQGKIGFLLSELNTQSEWYGNDHI